MNMIEKFIEEVRSRECLYNLKSPNYRSVEIKEEKWKEVSKKMGLEVNICKRKWKSLRDRYRKEIAKRISTPNKQFKPWSLLEPLAFLESADCRKNPITNLHYNHGKKNSNYMDVYIKEGGNISHEEEEDSISFSEDVLNEDNIYKDNHSFTEDALNDEKTSYKASQDFAEALINEDEHNSYKTESINDIDNSLKQFLTAATESFNTPQVIKTSIDLFLDSIAAQINTANVSPSKLHHFKLTVLNAAYQATKPA